MCKDTKPPLVCISDTDTIIAALKILANDIQTQDGVANAVLMEAADRLHELHTTIEATLMDNLHLCDGEQCTLLALKHAYYPPKQMTEKGRIIRGDTYVGTVYGE